MKSIPPAQNNRVRSLRELAIKHQNGCTVRRSYKRALEYWREAAALRDPVGLYSFGTFLEYGVCIPKDEREAYRLYRESLRLAPEYSKALYAVGACLLEGVGVRRNAPRARKLIERAAELGSTEARTAMKRCFGVHTRAGKRPKAIAT